MRKRLWSCGIGVTLVACILLWFASLDRLNLLDHSTRITSVRGWGLERPDLNIPVRIYDLLSGGAQYQWVGKRQILFFHDLKPIQNTSRTLDWPASVGTPTLYDLATHTEHPLPQLAELFRRSNGKANEATVSPTGSQLIWSGNHEDFYNATLDGSQHAEIEDEEGVNTGWLGDGQQCYTYGWSEDTENRNVIAVRFWDAQNSTFLNKRDFATPTTYTSLHTCVLLPDGSLATNARKMATTPGGMTLYHISPSPNSVIRAVSPTLPQGGTVDSLVYSPQGDRLAWIITGSIPSAVAFLQHWLPNYHPTVHETTSLWMSGTMGENLHEIGHIAVQPKGRQFYLIDYVRWQPDGKTLSFVSNDTLYTVPAN